MTFGVGDVVGVLGLTVLERDGPLNVYTDAGFAKVELLAADSLLLIVDADKDELRVFDLATGRVGRLNALGVIAAGVSW